MSTLSGEHHCIGCFHLSKFGEITKNKNKSEKHQKMNFATMCKKQTNKKINTGINGRTDVAHECTEAKGNEM